MSGVEDMLRRLALNDEQALRLVLDTGPLSQASSRLDPKAFALARVLDAAPALALAIGYDVDAAFDGPARG